MKEGFAPKAQVGPETAPKKPKSLSAEMLRFLGEYTRFVDQNLSLQGKAAELKAFFIKHPLMEAARHYDKTANDLEMEGHICFDGKNRETLENARGKIEKEFISALTSYYRELESLIMKVVKGIEGAGLGYLMEGEKYKEGAVQDLEAVFGKMMEAKTFSREKLEPHSTAYASSRMPTEESAKKSVTNLDDYINGPEAMVNDHPGESAHYHLEVQRLNRMFGLLGEEFPEAIKNLMFHFTRDMMAHLEEELGRHAMLALRKTGNPDYPRNIDTIGETPFSKIQFLLDIIIRSVRVLANIKRQRGLLLDLDIEQEEQSEASCA